MSLSPLTEAHYFALYGRPDSEVLLVNAREWLRRVNGLLEMAKLDGVIPGIDQLSGNHVASGYRSPGANARTSNAAAASKHLTCRAGDVQDTLDGQRRLAVWCIKNPDVLASCGLWMEDPRWTAGRTNTDPWVHFQIVPPGSGKRVYVPSSAPAQDPEFYTRFGLVTP